MLVFAKSPWPHLTPHLPPSPLYASGTLPTPRPLCPHLPPLGKPVALLPSPSPLASRRLPHFGTLPIGREATEIDSKKLNLLSSSNMVETERIEQLKIQLLEFADHLQQKVKQVQLPEFARQLQMKVKQAPETQLYAAAAVVLLTLLFSLLVRLFKRKKLNTIVLAGVSGSGKTVLFYQLRDGSSHQGTVTSMEPNEDTFVLHSETTKKGKFKPVHVVDVAGHSRLRPKLDEYFLQAAGLVFVVDALEFLHSCRQVAEYLYDILTKASIVKKKVPILIVCNKTEKVSAHSKEFIRKQLEKEIDKLRSTRTGLSDADVTNDYTLGVPGQPFAFSQCVNKVTVVEASALTGDISQVELFIREHVKP